ncbi:hypothetical protein [Anaerobacillus sp. 1_MG-2023]|uniref:hypothetical protein n=1 Tax=Anaerobacillus sp. 1_MG-2023 TaxID=3062655 RepID=UPI0026E2A22A|nr:hypothetical protein [Anaerobacillus sp. 1_MG-2023]MDO6658675.1 hypothetical protein [Anaerobacillus sp. 1_MG-2023]
MKTNIKNGIINLGEFATDTETIRLGDCDILGLQIETESNGGWFSVLGETDEKGIVKRLIIDLEPIDENSYEEDNDN